jgi:hypothetical protein
VAERMSDELRDLIERNHQVQELTRHPGWPLFCDYLRAQLEAKQRYLILGNAKDIEDYRKIASWVAGVTDALNAPQMLSEQVERARRAEDEARATS